MLPRRRIVLLLVGFLVTAAIPRARALEVGVARATRKVLPETPMPDRTGVDLRAARNEWEAFQLVIRHDAPLRAVDVALSDLCAPGGACVGAAEARRYRVWFVEVVRASPFAVSLHERTPGLYPDPLVPFTDPYAAGEVPVGPPFDLAAGETGLVFVDWYVPEETPPGTYHGAATVTAAGGVHEEIPITLTVWEVTIPRERTVATAFKLLDGGRGVRSYHGGPDGERSEDFEEIVARYQLALHEHRLDPTYLSADVDFTFDEAGQLEPVDWSAYDAAVAPWLDGGRFPDGAGVTRFDVHRFRPGSGTGDWTEAQYRQAAAAFAEHLFEKGWWERAWVYATDEPWNPKHEPRDVYADIARDAALLFEASELWRGRVLVTSPYEERLDGQVGIWCPDTVMYEDWGAGWSPYPGRGAYDAHLAAGGELWFYVCRLNIPPYAGYDIDTAIGHEPRIVNWGAWFERATGLLYWSVNYWLDSDPWHAFADFDEPDARNGNGFLIYPGNHDGKRQPRGSPPEIAIDGPVLSYRLKQIRDGLEDWELFRLAAQAGAESFVREQVRRAYTRFGQYPLTERCDEPYTFEPLVYCPNDQPWTLDEEILHDARDQVARKLQHLLHPDRHPDPEAPSPPAEPGAEVPSPAVEPGPDAASAPDLPPPPADTRSPADPTPSRSSSGCGAAEPSRRWWATPFALGLACFALRRSSKARVRHRALDESSRPGRGAARTRSCPRARPAAPPPSTA